MTPPEITRLEMDAAISEQLTASAKARASVAQLEYQRSLLGMPEPPSPTASSGVSWLAVALLVLAAFVIGAKAFDDGPHRSVSSYYR